MGRGAAIDPMTLQERQRMADLMYQKSLVPAPNEQSAAQGLARMLQGGIAGYDSAQVNRDREEYKAQRVSDMQKLASALGGGDYKSVIGQLSDPDAQMMAFSLAKSDMDNTNKFNNEMKLKERENTLKFNTDTQMKAYENALQQSTKQGDRDFEVEKLGIQNENTRALKGLEGDLNKEKIDYDPVKAEQRRMANYARVVSDPNAPPEYKSLAQQQLDSAKSVVAAMQPPKSSVTVDMGNKGETKMEEAFGGEVGKSEAKRQLDNIQDGVSASDQLSNLGRIDSYISEGSLGNLSTTTLGQVIPKIASRLGLPNDSNKIADFFRVSADQLVNMRDRLKGQGAIANFEQVLLNDTGLKTDDTLEAVRDKVFIFKQIANRSKILGDITRQWKDRYGAITRKGANGESFDSVVAKLVQATPIMSYEQMMKQKGDAATQNMGAQ